MNSNEPVRLIDLIRQKRYTPQELAMLLGLPVDVICQAAFRHDLKARIVGHDIVDMRREDVLAWLTERESEKPGTDRD